SASRGDDAGKGIERADETQRHVREIEPRHVCPFMLRSASVLDSRHGGSMSVKTFQTGAKSRLRPATQAYTSRLCSTAAAMKLANSGCGSNGRDFNSGWYCTPMNQGWLGYSTVSGNRPS